MKIRFTHKRRLLDNSIVEAGQVVEMEEQEAQGFIGNGWASAVEEQPVKKSKEVTDNG